MNIQITINGKECFVSDNLTVLQAAAENEVYIPHFCYHSKLSIAANCRMCLVQINKMPKPVPACATNVIDGMVIETDSIRSRTAQKTVMEFLLINHPLDCPICDQGGECQLQDLAVGYGSSCSNYGETKRVVVEKQLGPLITTAMTRCIHCTRCVRFGQEIAGNMELGLANRGEHAEILVFVGKTVDSEISGNIIDICPVGALNSKPFQFSARTWEMQRHYGSSNHDAWGSYLTIQVKDNRVKRVLPRPHEEINECWLSDRDRFSYTGIYQDRLETPLVLDEGTKVMRHADWVEALTLAVSRLSKAIEQHGTDKVGFLVGPQASAEEAMLMAKLARGLGCNNIDSRLRQVDHSLSKAEKGASWLGSSIQNIERLPSVLLVGVDVAKELPLLRLRLRKAQKLVKSKLTSIGSIDLAEQLELKTQLLAKPSELPTILADLARELAAKHNNQSMLPDWLPVSKGDQKSITELSEQILAGGAIYLGSQISLSDQYGLIRGICQVIAEICGGFVGNLVGGGNSIGHQLVGAVPNHNLMYNETGLEGLAATQMLEADLKAYLLLGCEPLDFANPELAVQAFKQADTVISLNSYASNENLADVLLPIANTYERDGTFVNIEGNTVLNKVAAKPVGEAKEAWKILRVVGKQMQAGDLFAKEDLNNVRQEIVDCGDFTNKLRTLLAHNWRPENQTTETSATKFERIPELSHFAVDQITRRAKPLQATKIAKRARQVGINPLDLTQLQLADGDTVVLIGNEEKSVTCKVRADSKICRGCLSAPQGEAVFAGLGYTRQVIIQPQENQQVA